MTEVPGEVTDKTQQGDQLLEDMDSLEKPDPEEVVPELEVDSELIGEIFGGILNDSLIIMILSMTVGFALVGYVLFGKR